MAELVTPGSGTETVTTYVRGLDLSQRVQGAGGIGGLLLQDTGSATRLYTYEANGNVGQLVDGTTGAVVAHYAYDPFGTTLTASGTAAAANPFRFSTKYTDDETGLLYYGYRFYSPTLGRWLTRDPIGEEGGANLYGFVRNNPANLIDLLGLIKVGIAFPTGTESAKNLFKNIARINSDKNRWKALNNGQEMIDFLIEQSNNFCDPIEVLTIAGHGWRFRDCGRGGEGIPGVGDRTGLYSSSYHSMINHFPDDATIVDLGLKIFQGKIKFAKDCLIQIHSCRIDESLSRELAIVTKCRVVAAAGSCRPYPKNPSKWQSCEGSYAEKSCPYCGFYEIIPQLPSEELLDYFLDDRKAVRGDLGEFYTPHE